MPNPLLHWVLRQGIAAARMPLMPKQKRTRLMCAFKRIALFAEASVHVSLPYSAYSS